MMIAPVERTYVPVFVEDFTMLISLVLSINKIKKSQALLIYQVEAAQVFSSHPPQTSISRTYTPTRLCSL